MDQQEYILLIQRYLAGKCNEEERKLFVEWIDKSPENKIVYEKVKKVWNIAPQLDLSFDEQKAWRDLEQRITELESKQHDSDTETVCKTTLGSVKQNSTTINSGSQQFLKIAAILIATFMLSLLAYVGYEISQSMLQGEPVTKTKVYEAGADEILELDLPDGTEVVLNSDSRLKIDEGFYEDHRNVDLIGEGYFQVNSSMDENKFSVTTNEVTVEVLGTRFNINSWEDRSSSEIIVESGHVGVKGKIGDLTDKYFQLHANEKIVFEKDSNTAEIVDVNALVYLGWVDSEITFDEAPVNDVFNYLERRFSIKVKVDDETEEVEEPITAQFSDESIEEILAIIAVTHDIDYEIDRDSVWIDFPSE